MTGPRDWVVTAPLRSGITLLEASAGTGKTYSITSLLLRLVAEYGVGMRELLVVTFTRAATAELRERIRMRLGEAVLALARPDPPTGDEVLAFLWNCDRTIRGSRLRRLQHAQHTFDECLIATIHGFCQRMLQQHAFESQADFDLELVTDTSEAVAELVEDWLSTRLYPGDPLRHRFLVEVARFARAPLLALAGRALADPDMRVLPSPDETPASGWPEACDALVRLWSGGGSEAVCNLYEQAHQAGAFASSRQRSYRCGRCRAEAHQIEAWLQSKPAIVDPPPNADYWSGSKVRSMLAPGQAEPMCAELAALRQLLSYPGRAAACERAAFVHWLRVEADRRNRRRRIQSYQDLLRSLVRVLRRDPNDPGRRALVHAIGNRFKVALIDEFQDTDPLQWTIFHALFGDEHHRLYLIGDPKQAIYGFRGANVHVYLEAQQQARRSSFTIRTNYRSDARLIAALGHLLDRPGFFGERGIEYIPVEAMQREPADRVAYPAAWSDARTAPVQLRFIDTRLGTPEPSGESGWLTRSLANALLPRRVAEDIVELLEFGARIHEPSHRAADAQGYRPLGPADIAVLTRTGEQARHVHAALVEAAVPAVLQGADSVFASDEARELQYWLEALASPTRERPARRAATTRVFGRDARLLAEVDAEEPAALRSWELWLERLASWRRRFDHQGFLATLRNAMDEDLLPCDELDTRSEYDVTARLLRLPDGDRRLTNLWHVAELAHEAQLGERLGLVGLLGWLKRQRARATLEAETAELRLERDDEAVQVMTMHKAKGLQFAVVFAPFLWHARLPQANEVALVVPSGERPAERALDLREAAERSGACARARVEAQKEALRLLYVTLTRAKHRSVLYTGAINGLQDSPLAAALHPAPRSAHAQSGLPGATCSSGATPEELLADLHALAEGSTCGLPDGARTIALSICSRVSRRRWRPPQAGTQQLQLRDFTRLELDRTWKRHSYTSVVHGKQVVYAQPAPDREGFDPDPEESVAKPATVALARDPWAPRYDLPDDAASVRLAAFPAGAAAGTFLHEVLEQTDFGWADPRAGEAGRDRLRALLLELLPQHGFDPGAWLDLLQAGLLDVLRTPLGGALGNARLCEVTREARLDELRFDVPICAGTASGRDQQQGRLAFDGLVAALCLRAGPDAPANDEDTIRDVYLRGLSQPEKLAGFLTGSIDLVFRHPTVETGRWYLVDYKSNRLDPQLQRRYPVAHYCREGMRYEMEQHHYYLQYHLYLLALHRYLRWRLGARYEYERDMGGVYYLFFRGMIGERTPVQGGIRHGAFYDRPPKRVVEALDRLFADPAAVASGARP